MATGFLGLPTALDLSRDSLRRIANVVNGILQGKLNNVSTMTLTANSATTVITDPRIGPNTVITPVPITANAAAEFGAGSWYWSSRGKQTATMTHVNNAQTDRTFAISFQG